jgi:phage terminase large subunit
MNECVIAPAFEDYLQPARFKVAYGGRGSAKTRTFVTILTNNVMCFGWRVVCFREIMKSLDDSVYQEFIEEIGRRDLYQWFDIYKSEIRSSTGGVIKFEGLHRNQQKIKGYSNFDCAWVEEAAKVTAESWKHLIPTLRKDHSEIWVSYNPEHILDDTHQRFVIDSPYPRVKDGHPYCIVKKINYTDNPWFPQELIDDMEIMERTDPDMFAHVYGGEPISDAALAVINPRWIEAAIDAHIKLDFGVSGSKRVGFDIADSGGDRCVTVYAHGSVAFEMEWWKAQPDELLKSCANAYNLALKHQSNIIYDSIGVGASAGSKFKEINESRSCDNGYIPIEYTKFNAGSKDLVDSDRDYQPGIKHKDQFANLKAQAWWMVADRFRNTYDAIKNGTKYEDDELISISSGLADLERLKAELSLPQKDFDQNGRVKVESKKDLDKRGVPSPDLADAFIMAFAKTNAGTSHAARRLITRKKRRR